MKAKDLMVIEFGAMSSKYSVEAEDKLTAYAAIILFGSRNAAALAIYWPEECKKDSWLFAPNLQERLDEIFGGDGFFAYLDQHPEVIKEVSENVDLENFIHDLSERYPEVSFAKLTRIAKAAYDYGKAEALKELSGGVRWRRIDKSPDFAESGEQLLEDGVKLYKNINAYMVVGLSRDGVLSLTCNHANDSYRGDCWYLTFNDLMKLPKEE